MNRVHPPSTLNLSYTQLRTLLTCPHQFALRYDSGALPTQSPSRWFEHHLTETLFLVYRDGWSLPDSHAAVLDVYYPPPIRADLDTLRTQPRARGAGARGCVGVRSPTARPLG